MASSKQQKKDKTDNKDDEGKKYSLFRSVFRSIAVKYENIKIMIEAEQNIDPVNRLTERFFSLWVDKVKHIVEWLA